MNIVTLLQAFVDELFEARDYYYGLLNALRNTKSDEKYSAEDVLKLTKNIYRVDTGDGQECKVSAIQKKTQVLLDALGVNLLRKN